MAYHAIASGSVDAAFRWSAAAGDEAMKVFAIRDAIGHYEQARQLVAEHELQVPGDDADASICPTWPGIRTPQRPWSSTSYLPGNAGNSPKMQDTTMECFAFNYLAVLVSENFSQLEQAMELLRDVLDVAERTNDQVGLAQTHLSLARIH